MAFESIVRAFEIISVTPPFVKGYFEKRKYLGGADSRRGAGIPDVQYFSETASLLGGESITPAGFYTGVWCRDASFILTELLEMGKVDKVASWLDWIWQNQIREGLKVVHGRGSPELGFRLRRADSESIRQFSGALPSSIQYSYAEVYGKDPDVDSTALMISITCAACIKIASLSEKLVPKLRNAVDALKKKDSDGDGLLEQGPNEDWMDTMLRSGKVVYSQAVWATALFNWSKLLAHLGLSQESEAAMQDCRKVLEQVNSKLWSDKISCYVDRSSQTYGAQRDGSSFQDSRITQDASSFLLLEDRASPRALKSLDTLKMSLWTNLGPCCMTPPTNKTGPRQFGAYDYQNGGIWPWITSSEILARKLHGKDEECTQLLKTILPYSYLEWVNPSGSCGGSYPFRTGVAAIRTAMRHIAAKEERNNSAN